MEKFWKSFPKTEQHFDGILQKVNAGTPYD